MFCGLGKLISLLILLCFFSCSNNQEENSVILSCDKEFVSYSTLIKDGIIIRNKANWSSIDGCIRSSNSESFKLIKELLYIKQKVGSEEVWYPYLLLSSNSGLSYTELLPFVSYSITNSLISKTDSTYTFHQVRQIVNGDIEEELIITLNRNWLPIEEKELKVNMGEQKCHFKAIDFSLKERPKRKCD